MTYKQAQRLVTKNIENMTLEQVQKHKVNLIDAWRHSEGFFGELEAVKNGFFLVVASEYASGFTPRDMFLTNNIKFRYYEAEKREQELLNE